MEPMFIEEDGKRYGVGIGSAFGEGILGIPELHEAMMEAEAGVLEECRVEGIIWTQPDEVRRRKEEAFQVVREAFGR